MSNWRNGIGRPSTPSLRARSSRLLDDEPRVQARGAVVLGCVRGRVADQVIVLKLHERDRGSRTLYSRSR